MADLDGDGIPDDLDPCDGDPIAPDAVADDDEIAELRILFPRGDADVDDDYLAKLAALAGDS